MNESSEITLAETARMKEKLEMTVRDALMEFTKVTGIRIDSLYVRPFEMFGRRTVDYEVEVEVKL